MFYALAARATTIIFDAQGGVSSTTVPPTLDPSVAEAKKTLTDTPLWGLLSTVSKALGVVVVIFGLYKVIIAASQGKAPMALKSLGLTILAAALLFRLDLVFSLIGAMGRVVQALITSLSQLLS